MSFSSEIQHIYFYGKITLDLHLYIAEKKYTYVLKSGN